METTVSQELLQSRLSFFHLGKLISSDDSRDRDGCLETGLKFAIKFSEFATRLRFYLSCSDFEL